MEKGLIHIYCGNGKGKTTTSMGLAVRAAGYGLKVLIYQFMKDNKSSERNVLENIENITIVNGLDEEKFSFQMSQKEKEERKVFYNNRFREITETARNENFDLLVMDEIIYTIGAGLLDEDIVVEYLKNKPQRLEVVLTGNNPGERLIEIADYVSEIQKVKHPFDNGISARYGIEK